MSFTPTVHRWDDGHLVLNWPEDEPHRTLIDRDVLFGIVDQLNELSELKARLEVLGVVG